jgi:hypothetical protein
MGLSEIFVMLFGNVAGDATATKLQQTDPPSVPIVDLFAAGGPTGEIQDYSPTTDGLDIAIQWHKQYFKLYSICPVL